MSEPVQPSPAEAPPPATKRRTVVVAGAVVAVLVIAAAAWFLTRPSGGELRVSGILVGMGWWCDPDGSPYVPTGPGYGPALTQITFRDASGNVVATARTGRDHWVPATNDWEVAPSETSITPDASGLYGCRDVASYAVSLPRSDLYKVSVGGTSKIFTVKLSDVTDGKLDIMVGSA